jgi:hypothetical protein
MALLMFFSVLLSLLPSSFAFSGAMAAMPVLNEVTFPFISLPLILSFLIGFYELVVRLVPTVTNISLLGKLIDIIKWLSDFLNRKK